MNKTTMVKVILIGLLSFTSWSCDKSQATFSLLSASQQFTQGAATVAVKIDILWVVDNSGSMAPLQQSLTQNFNSFISDFINKGYDFNMAVTTTDAYLSGPTFNNNNTYSKFKDGVGTTHTGVFVINPTTPNIVNTFVKNATQGDQGNGDERAFSSFQNALTNPLNSGFPRQGSFLAVIILSDEDDFSGANRPAGSWAMQGGVPDHDYTYAGLSSVASYVNFLDTLTQSIDPKNRHYSVSAITVLDQACLNSHVSSSPSSIIGQRYIDIANQTNGILSSICSNFATSLLAINNKILELSTQFHLDRQPIVSSISIQINGLNIIQDSNNGWTFDATSNNIIFHGTALPQQGATISVHFDPASAKT